MKIFEIISESKAEEFKSRYNRKFNEVQIKRIIDDIPQKYWEWVGKIADSINFNSNFEHIVKYLREFDKISSNLPKTDINSYKSIQELWDALNDYANKPKRDFKEVEGGTVVYDDGKYFVVNPLTHSASCVYGKGTKWCTSADSDYQFQNYNKDGKLFYILDRTLDSSDPYYKVALLRKFDGNNIFWTAKNENTSLMRAQMGPSKYDEMIGSIEEYMNKEFGEQIKIWSDKETLKKEKERQRQIEIQRILNNRRQEADDRRIDNEWDLTSDCPEVGKKAHALLDWLDEQGDIEKRTPSDTAKIMEIENLISELEERKDISDDQDEIADLENEIETFTEELDGLRKKVDVYQIIPIGNYYDLTEFEIIDADLDDRRYAVGDEDETKSSCEERVKELINDIGYGGFNQSFAKSFLKIDQILDTAYDYFWEDVNNNPDVYLDESQRNLSDKQEERIRVLEMKIERMQQTIEEYEIRSEEDEIDLSDKIEELQELIEEYENEIEEIRNDPKGEFPEELIDEKIEDLRDNVRSDPEHFLEEYGLDWEDYIDEDEFIEGVIDADGYGHTLSTYDGNADEVKVGDDWFYVIRID